MLKEKYLQAAHIKLLPSQPPVEAKESKPDTSSSCSETGFVASVTDVIQKLEDFVQKKACTIETLRKIGFELYGLLRDSKFPVKLDPLPVFPASMQEDLLRIDCVTRCAHTWGILTVYTGSEVTQETSHQIQVILTKHKYFHPCEIQRDTCEVSLHANIAYEVGNLIRGMAHPETASSHMMAGHDFRLGTLGGFVFNGQIIWALTCAHVVQDCCNEVQIHVGNNKYVSFGRYSDQLALTRGDMIDIAAVEVTESNRKFCSTKLKDRDGLHVDSDLFKGEPAAIEMQAKQVFKWGAKSDYTEGIIISTDHKRKCIEDANNDNSCGSQFDERFNIIVEALPGAEYAFSEEGDSGSVVCELQQEEKTVRVISMVTHAAVDKATHKYRYSFTSHLHKSLEMLREKSGYLFHWAASDQ